MRALLSGTIVVAAATCLAPSQVADAAPAPPAGASACARGEARLPLTGLCQREAARLLGRTAPPGAMPGCAWVIRETPFAADMLLYRTLRCGAGETAVELQVGNHMSLLTYTRRADGGTTTDADGAPLVLARIFAGHPHGRARALLETRDSVGDARAAARCNIRSPYSREGLPPDALIVDVARTPAALARDDAAPACGPFGYNPAGGSIDFWRPHQGHAWFFALGTDTWDVDPASFTLVARNRAGAWARIPDPR